MNLAVGSKFIDRVKNNKLRTMLATHYPAPIQEELRLKIKEYLLLKPPMSLSFYKKTIMAISTKDVQTRVTTGTSAGMTWIRDAFVQTAVPQTNMYQYAQFINTA